MSGLNGTGRTGKMIWRREKKADMAEIRYYDTLTIKHKDTKQFLHSHDVQYPLRYDDGRISSQGVYTFSFRCDLFPQHPASAGTPDF